MNFFLDFFYPEKRRREKDSRERQQRAAAEQGRIQAEQQQAEAARQAHEAQQAQQAYLFNNNLYVHGGADYYSDGIVAHGISRRHGGSGRYAPNRLASHAYYNGYSSGAESMAAGALPGAVPGYASEGYTYINRRVHPAFYGIPFDGGGYSSSGGSYAPPRIKLKKGARKNRKINVICYPEGTASKPSVGRTNPSFSEGEYSNVNQKATNATGRSESNDPVVGSTRNRRHRDEEGRVKNGKDGNTTDTTFRPRQGSGTSFPGMFGRTRSRTLVFPFRRERGSFLGTFRLKYDPRLLRAYDERNQWAMTMLYCWNSPPSSQGAVVGSNPRQSDPSLQISGRALFPLTHQRPSFLMVVNLHP
ncbi:hypothetical protein PoB_006727900 [Plakobranchus ocellatus]|uniref:Uncharacterized protein n=1 Tax=Plakobranchus ocellatus TaxID=259542 RepID=A0AAV4D9B6_9GAST|nr:hypothetical protein PoB_006727900 [Plakobranchus ocellatus]